ncbi:MAG: GNAT family N-acetyltransferase [Bacteroidota bacterium]
MSNYLRVSKATLDDLEVVATLFDQYRVFYKQESNLAKAKAFIKARLERSESVIFLAYWEDQPAGFTQLYPFFTSVGLATKWILNDLYVHASFRRRGVAMRLMLEAMDFAKISGAASISLETASDNHGAQRLYETLGWKKNEHFFVYDFPF